MGEKLLAILAKAKAIFMKLETAAPLALGIAIGYFGHAPIKLIAGAALTLAKAALHL